MTGSLLELNTLAVFRAHHSDPHVAMAARRQASSLQQLTQCLQRHQASFSVGVKLSLPFAMGVLVAVLLDHVV